MPSVKRFLLVSAAKFLSTSSQRLKLGAGATWPGEVMMRFDPKFLADAAKELKYTVLIAGTNGKTTTSAMVRAILDRSEGNTSKPLDQSSDGRSLHSLEESVGRDDQKRKIKIIHNDTGANLLNGLASIMVKNTDDQGKILSHVGVFEIDEASLPLVLKEFTPTVVVLLDLFRDQLDRYGEVDIVADKWLESLQYLPATTTVVINADDPHLAYIGSKLKAKVLYFGLGDKTKFLPKVPHAVDTTYCPNCGKKLSFAGVYLSHLGEWECHSCGFTHPKNTLSGKDVKSPLIGTYNIYNTMGAVLAAQALNIDTEASSEALKEFKPVFGRQEEMVVEGKKVKILLSKNPAGFNASLATVIEKKPKALLLVLNDRIPDGRDVSWIWDVDFEMLPPEVSVFVSGDRVYDMALRIKYASQAQSAKLKVQSQSVKLKAIENLKEAIREGLKSLETDETLYVLATYSAMLEVREIIGGRKIL